MNVRTAFWGALLISGSLGVSAAAHDSRWSERLHAEDRWTESGDDSALPPGVPGVTDDSQGVVSGQGAIVVEDALADNGYDPGRIDGMIDSDTRAAIREFQRDRDLAVTGTMDRETEKELHISRYSSGERGYPRS
jgi:hypothetical protein